ncbi:Carboxylesterase 3 [Trachymyrmex septentrionalis]|uniref:Carboxylic ester hydrolase n=1 Tax=Trachymyrmex septentrionalis TaxID=34720 RepID=A0A151JUE5_9HYME|nr:PREDICTED: esterase E4-like [Trachymyrmex septentrionalis]XP_018346755.1 PREDICTED: esterase E4-like [Trachymyrmex septentrionalis]KYN36171.1 Carboxylesterase 3 [Trachymyrmex septentrionalis]
MNKIRVEVTEGILVGEVVNGYNVRYFAFRGIPYAKPPIGELRFKDPMSAEPWSGERDASRYGNMALQVDVTTQEVIGNEDCLYLNVFTTKIESFEKRPVMVWIHGGGFLVGSGDANWFGPDYIVQKDVILITLNYRLSVLGFLNLNDKVAAGNQGLKDVVLALKWVQNNILKFGGNPENVTIFGQSAGAAITHCLALSPFAKGLFHKVILQSGVVLSPWAFNECMDHGFRLAKKLGKTTSDPKVAYEFLKTIDAKILTKNAQWALRTEEERLSFSLCFTPSLDSNSPNPFFPKHPKEYINRGIHVPFLLGFNREEGTFFLHSSFFGDINKENLEKVNADFKKAILSNVLSELPKIGITVEELRSLYFGKREISEETLINYAYFLGDEFLTRDTMNVCELQKSSGSYKSTYLYHFDYESESSLPKKLQHIKLPGVCHGEELFFLFCPQNKIAAKLNLPKSGSKDHKIINYLTQMWTDFAKTGNPTPATNLWLPLTSPQNQDYNYLNINLNPEMKIFYKGKERWNWESRKEIF